MTTLTPIDLASVIELKVPFKKPVPDDHMLLIEPQKCSHWGPFVIDDKVSEVTCKRCGEKLNPMYVLRMLALEESKWHRFRSVYQDELKRLSDRSRTKCEHCNKMTRISQA